MMTRYGWGLGDGDVRRICEDDDVKKSDELTESLVRTKLSTSIVKVAGRSLGFSASAFFWRAIVMSVCELLFVGSGGGDM
jgi:hypothetical protein